MGKITKTNMAVTVDCWIYDWIGKQNGKRSTVVNKILKDHIIAVDDEPKKQKRLLPMDSDERKAAFAAHYERLNAELDAMEDS